VVVGALSAFLVFNYVNSADDRARSNARQVDVLKIAKDIPKGLSGREAQAQGMIVSATIAAEFKPVTAIVDPSIIQDKVAVANYTTGQILVDGMFADPIENQITFAGRVPNDCAPAGLDGSTTGKPVPCVAVTISVDAVRGVAGLIVPGDYVNVLVLPETSFCTSANPSKGGVITQADNATAPAPGGAVLCNPARILFQAAKVLFVDKTAVPQPGEINSSGTSSNQSTGTSQNAGLITLEVPPAAAQMVASVDPSLMYLTLLPPDYVPEALGQVDPFPAVLPGEDATQLTPYGPQGFQGQK
jgi:hypothetical protein